MISFRHCVIATLLLCLSLPCVAQHNDTNNAPCIELSQGVFITEDDLDRMTADSPDAIPYYQVEGSFTIEEIREHGNVNLIVVVADSTISETPPIGHLQKQKPKFTIACWKGSFYMRKYQLHVGQKIACSLRSIHPLAIGHGEPISVHNDLFINNEHIHQVEKIEYSSFPGMLMEFIFDTLLILD